MALRDILVLLDASSSGLPRMLLAADLARRNGARLIVLYISHRTDAQLHHIGVAEMGLVPATKLAALEREITLSSTKPRNGWGALDSVKHKFGIDVEWRCITSNDTTQILIQHARWADLAVLGYHIENNDEINPDTPLLRSCCSHWGGRLSLYRPNFVEPHWGGQSRSVGMPAARPRVPLLICYR